MPHCGEHLPEEKSLGCDRSHYRLHGGRRSASATVDVGTSDAATISTRRDDRREGFSNRRRRNDQRGDGQHGEYDETAAAAVVAQRTTKRRLQLGVELRRGETSWSHRDDDFGDRRRRSSAASSTENSSLRDALWHPQHTPVRPQFPEEACLPDSRLEDAGSQHSARGLCHRCRRRRTRHRRERKQLATRSKSLPGQSSSTNTTLNYKFTRPVKHNVLGQTATFALHYGLTMRKGSPTRRSL